MTHWLIADSNTKYRNLLTNGLKNRGHRTTVVQDTYSLPAALALHRIDVVLLGTDTGMHRRVIEVCEGLRSWSAIPVIVVTDTAHELTTVQILDAGADDCIPRNYGIEELLARLRAIERRLLTISSRVSPTITLGDLSIDLATRSVWVASDLVRLTRKEYDLLRVLALAQGELVTYEKLLTDVWGDHKGLDERASVRTLIKQIRQKLRDDHSNPAYLITEPGVGYRLNIGASANS
ncbi:MAG: response regulator transcription factor [Anaerolineae bacterium]|nr:response regulator transcription factor [Anaerolineae bacterium]